MTWRGSLCLFIIFHECLVPHFFPVSSFLFFIYHQFVFFSFNFVKGKVANCILSSLCCGCLFLCVGSRGWGLGGAGFVVGYFLCLKYPVNSFSLLYYKQLFYDASLCAYINCFLSQGNWCSQFMGSCKVCLCVCGCSQLHGFIFSIFSCSFIAGRLFSLAFGGHLLPCDT